MAMKRNEWIKNTRSGGGTDMCVEVFATDSAVTVRSSADTDGPILSYTHAEWNAHNEGVKNGEFDL